MTATTKTTVVIDVGYDLRMGDDDEWKRLVDVDDESGEARRDAYKDRWGGAFRQAADELGVRVVFARYNSPEAIAASPDRDSDEWEQVQSAWQDLQDRAAKIMRERG